MGENGHADADTDAPAVVVVVVTSGANGGDDDYGGVGGRPCV